VVGSVLINLCMHGMVDSDGVPLWRPLQTGHQQSKQPALVNIDGVIASKQCVQVLPDGQQKKPD